ncbi:hypothetical protein DQ04_00071010 [Trypanosoma grayi]|uniref:hypothetical protein n=1 Tax=Trypanosoma grayi TaxID=71804 RepID=UPI0004F49534|nr:hypothetical protein DQ04_00071010 [Trypanosoma grayi]KEG15433.1 hypothetical protein DQ04_00071010 [Trypanosoma grayi]
MGAPQLIRGEHQCRRQRGAAQSGGRLMLLSATLHRGWYTAGDVVRAEVRLHGLPIPPDGETSALATRFGRGDNYFVGVDADAPPMVRVQVLSAQIVGICVVDSRRIRYRVGVEKSISKLCPGVANDMFPKDHDVYTLFCSDEFTLAKDLLLRERECKAAVVTFTLPEYLPPSFRGQCVRFYYGLHMQGTWCGPREPCAPVKLRLPIKVLSSPSVIVPLLIPTRFPLECFDFKEKVLLLQPVPSPAVTDPLQDSVSPLKVETFDVRHIRSRVAHSLAKRLAEQRTPLEFPLKLAGESALTVAVVSTTVMIGDSLNGVFLLRKNTNAVPVKVLGTLEFLECCRADLLNSGITCHPLPGGEKGLVVAQTSVIEELEWVLLDRTSVLFSVSFTNPNLYASMQTDVVTTCWQLRLRFFWCKSSTRKQCSASHREELKIEEEESELVVPLIIVPPPHPEHPHMGATLQVFC